MHLKHLWSEAWNLEDTVLCVCDSSGDTDWMNIWAIFMGSVIAADQLNRQEPSLC